MSELREALLELREEDVLRLVKERIAGGVDPLLMVEECRQAMELVGKRFECKEYFITELIVSGEIFNQAMELIEPGLRASGGLKTLGKMVLGTVQGDIHEIGKNIVRTMLRCSGFEVYDLGVDVPPQKFVQAVQDTGSAILGLSSLMTTSFNAMKETVELIGQAGLRKEVKIMVGGGPVNEMVREYVGADACAKDVAEAVELGKKFLGGL